MRRLMDIQCGGCGETILDQYVDVCTMSPHTCGGQWTRTHLPGRATPVHGDDIPGGVLIKNGLCHPDGSPRKYYSKSEMAREAARRGLTNHVEHIPSRGSDKNPNTQRWV
jgi:hypothetical protein